MSGKKKKKKSGSSQSKQTPSVEPAMPGDDAPPMPVNIPKKIIKQSMKNNFHHFREGALNLLFSKDFLISLILVFLALYLTSRFWTTLAPLFVAFILAYLLMPMVKWLQKYLKSREFAILTVFFVVSLVGLGLVIPMGLSLGKNVAKMADEISKIEYRPIITKVKDKVKTYREWEIPDILKAPADHVVEHFEEYQDDIEGVLKKVNSWVGSMFNKLGGFLLNSTASVFKRTMDVVIVLILLIYLLLDYEQIHKLFLKTVPPGYRDWMKAFSARADDTLRKFIWGQFKVAVIFGLLMTFGLWFLEVRFWMVIGPLSGAANLVPYLGVIFGLGPALIMAIYQGAISDPISFWLVLYVLIWFGVVQFIDGNLVQPKIVGESVGLHPLVIILALFVGAEMMGIYGMLFAVPIAAVGKVLVLEVYEVLYKGRSILLKKK